MGYLFAALVGALVMFFLDPERGAYRRNVSRDRLAGSGRDLGDDIGRAGRKLASDAYGVKQKIASLDKDDVMPNDETLAHKVESELFRDASIPKGDINVNCVDGVVYLRGQVARPDIIETIEARVRRIDGVLGVENLLHTAGTPAKR
jgi:hypothetical protein